MDSIQFLFCTVGSLLAKVAPLPEQRFVVQQGVGREDDHARKRCLLAPRVMGLLKNENKSIGISPIEHTFVVGVFP